ncbi:MAG: MFS transporter [Clostridia bacterium]|nr:MFS transporter [Clostridia bacterium]
MGRLSAASFAAIASVPFVMVLSNSMIIPVLPDIQRALDTSLFRAGLLITAFSVAAAAFIPLGGLLSDRWGRKAVIVPGLFLFGLGGLVAGAAPLLSPHPYPWMVAGRVVQGIGGGGTYQVAMALTGDLVQGGRRTQALGALEASNGLGKVVSPIAGAAAAVLAWYAAFFVYPLAAWPAAAAVWWLVREPKSPERRALSLGELGRLLLATYREKGAALASAFLAGSLAIFFLFGVLSLFSDLLERPFGVRGIAKGLVIAVPVAVMAATSFVSGTLLERRIARWAKVVVGLGLLLVALSFIAMFLAYGRVVAFTAAIALLGFGNGLLLPAINTLITSATGRAQRGTVTALYGTVRFLGAALGPPAFSLALPLGRAPLFFGSAAAAGLSLALAVWLIDRRKMLPPELGGGPERAELRRPSPLRGERAGLTRP